MQSAPPNQDEPLNRLEREGALNGQSEMGTGMKTVGVCFAMIPDKNVQT